MKKIFFFALCFMLLTLGINAQTTNVATTNAVTAQPQDINKLAEFTNASYDFGKIPFGKPVEFGVIVKNIGTEPLTLDNVTVGCGCTTPKYEKGKKILPGETLTVTLGFNAGTNGQFSKVATLYFNGNGGLNKVVNFKGETYQVPATPAPTNGTVDKIKAGN